MRDIIDIDSTYEDFESLEDDDELKINKKSKNKEIKKETSSEDKKEEEILQMTMNLMYLWLKWRRK